MTKNGNACTLEVDRDGSSVACRIEFRGEWSQAFDSKTLSDWWRAQANGNSQPTYQLLGQSNAAPGAIDIVPFVANLLPIAMVYDAEIIVDTIDEHFLSAIPFIRRRLQQLYPELPLKGRIKPRSVEYHHVGQPNSGPVALFSGGVDAVFTALANRVLEPTLLCVHGADVFFGENNPWPHVEDQVLQFASKVGMNVKFVRSTFRTSINYGVLDPLLRSFGVKDNWWHGLQFGMSLSALALPVAFRLGADHVLLASDYSNKDSMINRSGSDSALVQEIRAGGILARCHDFNVSRQQKIAFICDFAKTHGLEIPLRVCWKSTSGDNCGLCEKCLRTQFAILAFGENPERFGFIESSEVYEQAKQRLRDGEIQMTPFWQDLKRDLAASPMRKHPLSVALLEKQD